MARRHLLGAFLLLAVVLVAAGCQQAFFAGAPATPESTPEPVATSSPTATATITPTSVPMASSTPAPSPTSTATPAPSPTPRPAVSIEPDRAAQGETVVVRVRTAAEAKTEGSMDGAPLVFGQGQGEAWAVIGIGGLARLGPRAVQARVTNAAGGVTSHQASFEVVAANWPVENIDLPPGQGGLLAPAIVVDEFALLRTTSQRATAPPRWQGRFLRPSDGEESSPYGTRRSYNGGPASGQHEGMDFAVSVGSPIRAAAPGKVAVAQMLQVRGNAILLDHGGGVVTGYYHLSEMLVQEGQDVAAGSVIGRGGATGLATGPHLHWDVIIGGVNVDPAAWLERAIP